MIQSLARFRPQALPAPVEFVLWDGTEPHALQIIEWLHHRGVRAEFRSKGSKPIDQYWQPDSTGLNENIIATGYEDDGFNFQTSMPYIVWHPETNQLSGHDQESFESTFIPYETGTR